MIPFDQQLEVIERDGTRDANTRRWSVSDVNTEQFQGHVAPVSGDDLELLPEGERTGHEIKVITERNLRIADEDQDPPKFADHVRYDGDRYKVQNVETYDKVIPHVEAVCTKV